MNKYFELHIVSPKKNEPPFPSSVYIALKRPPQPEEGKLLLSPMLMSEREIDNTFDMLIDELQSLRKKAKKNL
jgi:hypothetical protein